MKTNCLWKQKQQQKTTTKKKNKKKTTTTKKSATVIFSHSAHMQSAKAQTRCWDVCNRISVASEGVQYAILLLADSADSSDCADTHVDPVSVDRRTYRKYCLVFQLQLGSGGPSVQSDQSLLYPSTGKIVSTEKIDGLKKVPDQTV